MNSPEDVLKSLRAALEVSPDNAPLRRHLADTLLGHGRPDEAAEEYRRMLIDAPKDAALQLALARAYFQAGKFTQALVVVEELLKADAPAAGVLVLFARLLYQRGEVERAVRQYRAAVSQEPALADDSFAQQLGIDLNESDNSEVVDGRVRLSAAYDDDEATVETERPKINFADVGGMDAVKEDIRLKIILPLEQPELFKAYGKTAGGGILLYGPPGCGKTHLARATAGEIKANFLSVGINDVLDMWLGNSERNLHVVFEQARRLRPCVLFFDEIDALGASRADMRHTGGRHLINQFLAELDGAKSSNEGVLILGATNAPWHIDNAFRRPGRFDRIVFVPPPDTEAREAILRILCRDKPTAEIDFATVAKKTPDFSGADLNAVVEAAVEAKLRSALRGGGIQPLGTRDLIDAARSLKPTTKEWFASARNYALYSNQGGTYDDILKYLKM
jgi:SpoVK/Ycf46/Vps4 family AAA+-type ATPase